MTRGQAQGVRPVGEVARARAECWRAYEAARGVGGMTALTVERLYAGTLTLHAGQRTGTQAEMFRRPRRCSRS